MDELNFNDGHNSCLQEVKQVDVKLDKVKLLKVIADDMQRALRTGKNWRWSYGVEALCQAFDKGTLISNSQIKEKG